MLQRLWNWIKRKTGWGSKQVVDPPHVESEIPVEETPVKPMTPEDPDYEIAAASTWMQLFTENAETWEKDQRKYMNAIRKYGLEGAAQAIRTLDWSQIVKHYTPKTLDRIYFDGTLLSLQDEPDTKLIIQGAVRDERSRRVREQGRPAPKTHGMDEHGNQK